MRLLLALVLGSWYLMRPSAVEVLQIPFDRLTLRMFLENGLTGVLGIGCICALVLSLNKDRIWPWRWDKPPK